MTGDGAHCDGADAVGRLAQHAEAGPGETRHFLRQQVYLGIIRVMLRHIAEEYGTGLAAGKALGHFARNLVDHALLGNLGYRGFLQFGECAAYAGKRHHHLRRCDDALGMHLA
jgi:hypothetical protein